MKCDKIRRAIGGIDADLIEAADRTMPAKQRAHTASRYRIPRAALIAAVLVVLLSVSAIAYYVVSHANTAALMEAGPFSNGNVRSEIDETGQQLIENAAIDLGFSQTSNGTTITLDSMLGFKDTKESLMYLTFTITPPEGYEFPEDMQYWCFWNDRRKLVPEDYEIPYTASTVKNPDGSASVLWAMMPQCDLSGYRLHIEIGGFGTADKELVASLYDGSRVIELPGSWTFDFTLPDLPDTQEITLDAAALREAGLPVTALRLSDFGGIAELEHVQQLENFTLEYPDGTEYTVSFGENGDNLWLNMDEQSRPFCQVLFLNPQPVRKASAIVIDGVRIPLK